MKKLIFIALSCFILLSNCSNNNDNIATTDEVEFLWHLVSVTGGITGVDEQFDINTIVWNFDDLTRTLVVDNQNTDDSIEDSLDSGTYNFSVFSEDNQNYLIINDVELGLLEVTSNTLTIDQNFMSTNTLTDGFIYTFTKQTIVIE